MGVKPMFPLTHLYFADKLWHRVPGLPYDASLIALGCTFPDIVMAGLLEHPQTHRGVGNLVNFFQEQAPELLPFALGVLTHGSEPKGLDYYGDEKYQTYERGYCFEKAKPLVADVVKYCNLPDKYGWWKAHNFIEMAIEIELGELRPDLQQRLYNAYQDTGMIQRVSEILQEYFQKPIQEIVSSINFFAKFIAREAINTTELAEKYCLQMTSNALIVDTNGVEATINHARILVKADFCYFEEIVLEKMTKLFDEHL